MIVQLFIYLPESTMDDLAFQILGYLDVESLQNAELVSTVWREAVVRGRMYTKLFERNVNFYL